MLAKGPRKRFENVIFKQKYVIERDILTSYNNVPIALSRGGVAEQLKCLLVPSKVGV